MKRTIVAAAVAVAVVAGGVTGWVVTDHHHSNAPAIGAADVAIRTSVTTAQLVHGTWAKLPNAPIADRLEPVGLWTGHELFVWGGAPQGGPWRNTGATYDPAARTWAMLPTSPLGGRRNPAAVLAGHQVFIWGGTGTSHDAPTFDGATYDLTSKTWTILPDGPREGYQWAQALWTGKQVILLTAFTYSGAGSTDPSRIHAHAYDPAKRRWTTLPDLVMPAGQKVEYVTAVSTGSQIWVWPHWDHTVKQSPSSYATTAGVDTYVYDLVSATWKSTAVVSQQGGSVPSPFWTGTRILIPWRTFWCGICSGPMQPARAGLQIDPATNSATPLPTGSISDLRPTYIWTGADLLAYDTDSATVGGTDGIHHPGEAAVWDPSTNAWQKLPSAPMASSQGVSVWTGGRLLIWGAMYDPIHPSQGQTAGIEFVPRASGLIS